MMNAKSGDSKKNDLDLLRRGSLGWSSDVISVQEPDTGDSSSASSGLKG